MLEWVLIIGTALLSVAGTGVVLKWAPSLGLIHAPNDRSSHKALTPHGGGLGLVVAFLLGLSLLLFLGKMAGTEWFVLAGCGGLVAGVGFWDDIHTVAVRWRFLAYLVAVGLGVTLLGGLPALTIGSQSVDLGLAGDAGAVLLLLWWLNLYNFMDGIDGLASVQALSMTLSAILLLVLAEGLPANAQGMGLQLLLLAAAVAGFLLWNRPPARIFLGDVGSTFLGFALGMLALDSIAQGLLSPWAWLILGGVFIVDATLTLLRRMLRRERWYEPHRRHAYQKATSRLAFHFEKSKGLAREKAYAMAHGLVSLLVLALNVLWLLPLACAAQYWPVWGPGFVLLAWLPLLLLALYLGAGKQ